MDTPLLTSTRFRDTLASTLRRSVEQGHVTTKRKSITSDNSSWYPYYAGYSANFVKFVLEQFASQPNIVVADPWNGCGTTTSEASRLGFSAVGFDINPFAVLAAQAKAATPEDGLMAITVLSSAVKDHLSVDIAVDPADTLLSWLPVSTVRTFRMAQAFVVAYCQTLSQSASSLLLLSLIRAARDLAPRRKVTNPTWNRPGLSDTPKSGRLFDLSQAYVKQWQDSLLASDRPSPFVLRADSRLLPLRENSVQIVITSPPYCTRLDYAVSTSFELAALGISFDSKEFKTLRKKQMGTPGIREVECRDYQNWPTSIRSLLDSVQNHDSYESSGYYFRNLWQYFDDATRSIREITRVLSPGGIAILVLQTSYFKNIEIDLSSLYIDMAIAQGLSGCLACRQLVRQNIASINKYSTLYKPNKHYYEDIVLLSKQEEANNVT